MCILARASSYQKAYLLTKVILVSDLYKLVIYLIANSQQESATVKVPVGSDLGVFAGVKVVTFLAPPHFTWLQSFRYAQSGGQLCL
jgi:hypothetical protein